MGNIVKVQQSNYFFMKIQREHSPGKTTPRKGFKEKMKAGFKHKTNLNQKMLLIICMIQLYYIIQLSN
jgi:hypothetical protein